MTVTGESWEELYNALLEKANTEDWSPRVQVYKEKLEVALVEKDVILSQYEVASKACREHKAKLETAEADMKAAEASEDYLKQIVKELVNVIEESVMFEWENKTDYLERLTLNAKEAIK